MDYVTRQFIFLAKKFRKELRKGQESLHRDLTRLSDRLKNLKDAVSQQRQSDNKGNDTPAVTVTELRTQVPIRVDTKTKKSKPEWVWAVIKGTLEIVTVIAVLVYTAVSYGNWQEQIDATNFAGIQAKKSRQALNETIKNFRLDQRPWIGVESYDLNATDGPINVAIKFTNSGKTPAFHAAIAFETSCLPLGKPEPSPSYTRRDAKSRSIVMPSGVLWGKMEDSAICNAENTALLKLGKATIYVLATVWYDDEFRQPHHTDVCAYTDIPKGELDKLKPPIKPGTVFNGYPTACRHHNDAD